MRQLQDHLLTHGKKARCCHELEACSNALEDDRVLQAVGEKPSCIVNHPGFEVVCLNVWSLTASGSPIQNTAGEKI